MERLLEHKICLITGAGRGIGRAVAELFAELGATVYANDARRDAWTAGFRKRERTARKDICLLL